MKWTKDEETKLLKLLKDGLSYKDISGVLNRTARSIKEKTNKLGYKYSDFIKMLEIECLECGKIFVVSTRDKREIKRKFCSRSCSTTFNNKNRSSDVYQKVSDKLSKYKQKTEVGDKNYCLCCNKEISRRKIYCDYKCQNDYKYQLYIQKWKNNEVDGKKGEYSISRYIRRYMFEKYENKCAICGWNEVNNFTGKIPLEIEHIDGDYTNNKEKNLMLICPNCHSLTKTYKGANRGKGRKERRKYNLI